jgi:hypothetical protein
LNLTGYQLLLEGTIGLHDVTKRERLVLWNAVQPDGEQDKVFSESIDESRSGRLASRREDHA